MFSTRDTLSLVSEVRIFLRVVVYWLTRHDIWVQNWLIGKFLYLDLVWFGILTVSAVLQFDFAVSFSFFFWLFRMFYEPVHDNTFSCGRSLNETFHCEVLSAKNSSEFGWILLKVPRETLQREVLSTRDTLSLVSEVRIFLRVVVYRLTRHDIWVQNWLIGKFLYLDLVWFGILTVSAVLQFDFAVSFSFFFWLFRMFYEPVHDNTFSCGRSLNETFHCEVLSAKNSSEFGWILLKVPRETLQREVFSTEDFNTSLRCFLDGTLQCYEVFSKKVHRVEIVI